MNPNMSSTKSILSATLMRLADSGKISRKAVQFAGDVSYSEAERFFLGHDTPNLATFIAIVTDREIDLSARLTIANAVFAETGFRVECAELHERGTLADVVRESLLHACHGSTLAKRMHEICGDKVVTTTERAEAQELINVLRESLTDIEQQISQHVVAPALRAG